MNTSLDKSVNFEKLCEMIGTHNACSVLNDLIAEKYNELHPNATVEQTSKEWDSFCENYNGSAADELITEEILDEYEEYNF